VSRRTLRGVALAACLACAAWLVPLHAGASQGGYDAKAAFLLNFARLVIWPLAARPGPDEPVVIGVAGGEAAREAIERGIDGASVESHRIEVRSVEKPEQVPGTHILFVAGELDADAETLIEAARGHAALSVGESDGFAARGGIINFFSEGDKLRFEINLAAARATGLQISSHMLGLARLVETGE
jgi:hypothetical protein